MNPEKAEGLSLELQTALEPWLAGIESLSDRIREYNERIEKLAQERYPQVALLKQVKGVGRQYYGWFSDKMISRYSHSNRAALLVVAAAMDNKSREEAPRRVRRGQDSKRLERNNGKLIVFHAR